MKPGGCGRKYMCVTCLMKSEVRLVGRKFPFHQLLTGAGLPLHCITMGLFLNPSIWQINVEYYTCVSTYIKSSSGVMIEV